MHILGDNFLHCKQALQTQCTRWGTGTAPLIKCVQLTGQVAVAESILDCWAAGQMGQ